MVFVDLVCKRFSKQLVYDTCILKDMYSINQGVKSNRNPIIRGSVKNYSHFMPQLTLVFKLDAVFPENVGFCVT